MDTIKKILFIQPLKIKPPIFPLAYDYIYHPLNGIEMKLIDLSIDEEKTLYDELKNYSPDIVLWTIKAVDDAIYHSRRLYIKEIKEVFEKVKKIIKDDCKMVIGGSGFSIMPERILEEIKADVGIAGDVDGIFEDKNILKEIGMNVENSETKDEKNILSEIKVITKDNYKLIIRDIAENNYEKIKRYRNEEINKLYFQRGGIIPIETKRGCSLNCSFCVEPLIEGNKVKCRPPERVVEEINNLLNNGIYFYFFTDSEFNLPRNHAENICQTIIKEGLNKKIMWTAYLKPIDFDKDFALLLKEAGCWGIILGVESLSEIMLQQYNEKYSVNDIINACKICDEIGLRYSLSLLFGGPGENETTIEETFKNMKRIRPSPIANIMCGVRIYPNTPLYKQAKEEGLIQDSSDLLEPIFYDEQKLEKEILPLVMKMASENPCCHMPGKEGLVISSEELKNWYEKGNKGPYWAFWEVRDKVKREIENYFIENKVIFVRLVYCTEENIYLSKDIFFLDEDVKGKIKKIDENLLSERKKSNIVIWLDIFDKITVSNFNLAVKKEKEPLKIIENETLSIELNERLELYYNILESYYDQFKKNKEGQQKIEHIVIPVTFEREKVSTIVLFVNILKETTKDDVQYLLGFNRNIISYFRSEYEEYFYKKIIHHALRSAVAAIMARNMSHNIQSHAASYAISELEESRSRIYPPKEILPLINLLSYVKARSDFIAEVSTFWSEMPWLEKLTF